MRGAKLRADDPGRDELLAAVVEHGTITAAAKALGWNYATTRRRWRVWGLSRARASQFAAVVSGSWEPATRRVVEQADAEGADPYRAVLRQLLGGRAEAGVARLISEVRAARTLAEHAAARRSLDLDPL